MSVEESLFSKMADDNNAGALDSFGILREHLVTDVGRNLYDFTRKYAAENNGSAPSYVTLVENVEGFTYMPAISDSYEYLTRKLKEHAGTIKLRDFLSGTDGEIQRHFETIGQSSDIGAVISLYTKRLEEIKIMGTNVRKSNAIDIAKQADLFLTEYRARAAGLSGRIWLSKFPGLNAAIGGYSSSNMYVFYARSGRGKSVVTMEEAIEFAWQGATVLIWALEMGWFEWMARAFSSISARIGVGITATIDGVDYAAGFDTNALQAAKLTPEYEKAFERFVETLNGILPGRIVLKASNTKDFDDHSLVALRADILEASADVVIVDPFYYLDYETNSSKTSGGDAAATSKKLRIMTGSLNIVTIAITQADEDASEKGEDGVREMKPPKRSEVKKTKALLEDGAALIGVDTLAHEGRGVIEVGKGRSGGEDTRIEIVYLPNYGIVREPNPVDTASQFAGNF